MKRGKYERISPKGKKTKRCALPLILALLVLSIGVGSTLAYIIAQTDDVANAFIPGEVKCAVNDDLTIKNTSNVKAYIRAMVVINWMDSEGNVYGTPPVCAVTTNPGWSYDSVTGIYYYGGEVEPNATVPAPASISEVGANPDSSVYSLQIEVVAEAIQSEGMGAVSAQDAWVNALQSANNG